MKLKRTTIVAAVASVLLACAPGVAHGAFATGGAGRFLGTIDWVSWGRAGTAIPTRGATASSTVDVGGSAFVTTCTVSNVTRVEGASGNSLAAYRPGTWQGDGFDELYNVGGTGTSNQLVVGLSVDSQTLRFSFSCSATLGGVAYPLAGIVFADAEQSDNTTEYVQGAISTGTWRVIDRYRTPGCTASTSATNSGGTLRLNGVTPACSAGPTAVAFADGATSGTIEVKGGGKSAVALGAVVAFDHGDAPAGYGDAAHALQFGYAGGTVGSSATNVSNDTFALATTTQPTPRLGTTVDPEGTALAGATAAGDDTNGSGAYGPVDDEDAFPGSRLSAATRPGATLTQSAPCVGSGFVAGWIDFDGNGSFDADERSASVACTSGSAALSWTVPADMRRAVGTAATYLRVRTAATAAAIASPTGQAANGETEDYAFELDLQPQLTVRKAVDGRVRATDQFTVGATGPGLPSGGIAATTTGAGTTAATARTFVQDGGSYALTDAIASGATGALAAYDVSIACVDAAASNAAVSVTGTSGRWALPNIRNGQDVICTVTNAGRPAIALDKQAGPVVDANRNGRIDAGDTISYDFQVANTGGQPLSSIAVGDPKVGAVSCPATTLAAGIAMTCRATYTLTQADVDAGSVPNAATVSGRSPTGTAVTASDETSVSFDAPRSLGLDKQAGALVDANRSGRADAGDTIAYRFLVTNGGSVTLTSVSVADPKVGTVSCPAGPLGPGATRTCTATYTVTQADVDAGAVVNQATASGTPPSGAALTARDDDSVPLAARPSLAFDKQVGAIADTNRSGRADAGDEVVYRFVVTNTGNVTLTGVTVSDPTLGPVTCSAAPLAPGASRSCGDVVHRVTQDDVDLGAILNRATATATPPSGPAVQADDSATVTIAQSASLRLDKQAGAIADANRSGRADAGDTIAYRFVVTNTGNMTLGPVIVTDPKIRAVVCPSGPLAPGATRECSATYVLTQADVDAGRVDNRATATGTPRTGPDVTSDDADVAPIERSATLALDKEAGAIDDVDGNGVDAGDTIAYTFLVTNTGNQTLTGVTVDDPTTRPVACPQTTLAPGASMTCRATYTLTQDDVDAPEVVNRATATGTPPDGPPATAQDTVRVATPNTPGLVLDKRVVQLADSDGDGQASAGDTITYAFTVENTGNVTLTPVVADPLLGGPVDCPGGPLAPGRTRDCPQVAYTVTQSDVDAGEVLNTASARAVEYDVADEDSAAVPLPSAPAIELEKQASGLVDENGSGRADAGDAIAYRFVVTNTGNVAVDGVTVTDPKIGPVTCPPGRLEPGASRECTAGSYTIAQADVNDGAVVNEATARATPVAGTDRDPVSASDGTTTPLPAAPSLRIEKSVEPIEDTNRNGVEDAGDIFRYSFTVENTGNLPLSDLVVTDPLLGTVTCASTTLAPGAATRCTAAPYVVRAGDVNVGVRNTARATARTPSGGTVSDEDSTFSPVPARPNVKLDKRAGALADANGDGILSAGDTIAYEFTVTNVGNETLDPIAVQDPLLGTVTCEQTRVEPRASTTCRAPPYELRQADIDAGRRDNRASVRGRAPDGGEVTSSDSATVPLPEAAAISLDKQAGQLVDADGNGIVSAGDTIEYAFVVANRGNRALTDVTVEDPKVGPVSCPAGPLAPGASVTCGPVTYGITAADVVAGEVVNRATASGTSPTGTRPQDGDTATVQTPALPRLELTKDADPVADANGSGRLDAGDTISYTFVVENTGNVALDPVAVVDPKIGAVTCPGGPLPPGARRTCTADAPYAVTQAEIDAGVARNAATATGAPPSGPDATADDDLDVPLAAASGVEVDKQAEPIADANRNGRVDAGDTIAYGFTVRNTGTTTLTDVAVADAKLGAVSCEDATLAPGATTRCTAAPYALTVGDLVAGAVENRATVTARQPGGASIGDDDVETVPTPYALALTLDKRSAAVADANRSGRVDVGDTIAYEFELENTGNVPLDPVAVSDAKVGAVTCDPARLEPGASVTCTAAPYVLTQADVDAGSVENTATATGDGPNGDDAAARDTELRSLNAQASIALRKSAGAVTDANRSGRLDAGDTIAYAFEVTNTGARTLRDVAVSDPKLAVSCPAATLAPGRSFSCTGTYTLVQADLDAGTVDNDATAVGVDPDGDPVDASDGVRTPLEGSASIALRKTAAAIEDANRSGRVDAGDTIAYSFAIENTGTVTLTGVALVDPLVGTVTCPPEATTLDPGERATCTATHTLDQDDVDAGSVENRATVTGTPPSGGDVSESDAVMSPVEGVGTLTLDKRAGPVEDANRSGRTDAGDTISYSFDVRNEGARTLSDVAVVDPRVGTVVCPVTVLRPGDATTCTATYTLSQADVDAGRVENEAFARALDARGGEVVSEPDRTLTVLDAALGIVLRKTAGPVEDANANGRRDTGDRIPYVFVVRNDGARTLSDVAISDPKLGAVSCPSTSLAPGEQMTCTAASYEITVADLLAGSVDNVARATARGPAGEAVEDDDSVRVETPPIVAIELEKLLGGIADANGSGRLDAGDEIAYRFVVTNSGTVPFETVTVTDAKVPGIACGDGPLAPGAERECTAAPYVLTQDDVDAGSVVNRAVATGAIPGGEQFADDDELTTPLAATAQIALDKRAAAPLDVNGDGYPDAGDTIAYSFTVANTGVTRVSGVSVSDPLLGAVTCEATALEPGETTTCTAAPYTITDRDVLNGAVRNTATATAQAPGGGALSAQDTAETATASPPRTPSPDTGRPPIARPPLPRPPTPRPRPAGRARLAVSKTTRTTRADAGDRIAYTITVRNTGRAAARSLRVCDVLPRAVSIVSFTRGGRLQVGTRVCWTAKTLARGARRSYRIVLRVDRAAPTQRMVNTATAAARGVRPARARETVRVVRVKGQSGEGGGVTG